MNQISNEVKLDKVRLMDELAFLESRRLVGREELDENTLLYFITRRGLTVLKVTSPIIREAHKIQVRDFEAISNSLSGIVVTSGKEKTKKLKWKVPAFIKENSLRGKLSEFIKIEIVDEAQEQES